MSNQLYDVIGVGVGPFNLGLAALLDPVEDLNGVFFEQTNQLEWHPGMLIKGTNLQVPFLADLVTFADPTSRFSFVNYLHKQNRLYPFFFFQELQAPREEYNEYLQWVAGQLEHLHFSKRVVDVEEDQSNGSHFYKVTVEDMNTGERECYNAKHIVMGTGSTPLILDGMEGLPEEDVVHTSRYLYKKEEIVKGDKVTVIGSGQSAAEIVEDLLAEQGHYGYEITWLTRSPGLFQLDTAKLPQEFFSPDYVTYFNSLTYEQRKNTLSDLDSLQNGVDPSTLSNIYNWLYHRSIGSNQNDVTIQPVTEVSSIEKIEESYKLHCHQWQADDTFTYNTDKVVLATGYKPNIPDWFNNRFAEGVVYEDENLFKVGRNCEIVFKQNRNHKIFVTTNISHSHGTGANNLGLSVSRNIKMINTIAGRVVYPEGEGAIFQQFRMSDRQ
ncbi:lysine N(6)-hydroxylase/L-ornithine N(5)-oxygenase family protein [Pontibacillus sp. ALD_SL1]|uniref:lysine N(6)-hydroxylase/L-ornithine N(5)-oxygenase family protein n=1 Tax=Pontibacillus sp. ALD_SL1 TaxID=2777185 RepID=UPI001A969846|nr:SidA/IucD/PvdA family monooxygenase [Pontibacillus sp. ALD_SL1]QST00096.1 lysine N(6)-hydroxylase/L-ornithine N(5)-oxygenase family protein [Pontibacillus sp. ALD_SL1]